jgi:hypothetical protein
MRLIYAINNQCRKNLLFREEIKHEIPALSVTVKDEKCVNCTAVLSRFFKIK